MVDSESAWRAHQRARWMLPDAQRWLRPDAGRWIRQDVARFLKPGTLPADVFPALDRKFNPNQPRIPAGQFGGGRWTDGGEFGAELQAEALAPAVPASSDVPAGASGPLAFQAQSSGSLESWLKQLDDLAWKDPRQIPNASVGDIEANLQDVQARRPSLATWFPSATTEQLIRLDIAISRTEAALTLIRRYDESWEPRERRFEGDQRNVDSAIAHNEARASEAERYLDRLRFGIGGNGGPRLDDQKPDLRLDTPVFDGAAWIRAYRIINNSSDLFGHPDWPDDRGVVAAARIGDELYIGVNSDAPGYSSVDRRFALNLRDRMVNDDPNSLATDNIGNWPNDAFFHAEANLLIRAHRHLGDLSNRTIEVQVDRYLCGACGEILPAIGLKLGNPYVTFVELTTGSKSVMWNGRWLSGKFSQ